MKKAICPHTNVLVGEKYLREKIKMKSLSKKKYLRINTLVWGFTIMELLVAVGLLAAVLAAAGMVFNYSINAQRTAAATAEIMRTLRAITDQINIDFTGLQKNAPVIVRYSTDTGNNIRADSIVFFATGDFQTMDGTVRGNTARIYYGQAEKPDPNSTNSAVRKVKVLARKQVILAPAELNSTNEYEPNSLIQDVEEYLNSLGSPDPNIVSNRWLRRPEVDPNDVNEIPMYFAKGVDDFTIMIDADVNSTNYKIDWWPKTSIEMGQSRPYPDLVKFTFTLYDSRGLFKNGRKFEHIVYIGQ
jgi:type II secretory pathway pseudopilin PulG